jgi:hypothetical protein
MSADPVGIEALLIIIVKGRARAEYSALFTDIMVGLLKT